MQRIPGTTDLRTNGELHPRIHAHSVIQPQRVTRIYFRQNLSR